MLMAHRLHATRGQRLFALTILLPSPVTSVSAREAGADDGREAESGQSHGGAAVQGAGRPSP